LAKIAKTIRIKYHFKPRIFISRNIFNTFVMILTLKTINGFFNLNSFVASGKEN